MSWTVLFSVDVERPPVTVYLCNWKRTVSQLELSVNDINDMNVLSLHCTVDPYVIAGDDDDDVQAYVWRHWRWLWRMYGTSATFHSTLNKPLRKIDDTDIILFQIY